MKPFPQRWHCLVSHGYVSFECFQSVRTKSTCRHQRMTLKRQPLPLLAFVIMTSRLAVLLRDLRPVLPRVLTCAEHYGCQDILTWSRPEGGRLLTWTGSDKQSSLVVMYLITHMHTSLHLHTYTYLNEMMPLGTTRCLFVSAAKCQSS